MRGLNPAARRLRRERVMKHSADRILTTHVGSLLRPVDVLGFMKAKGDGEAYDKQAFAAVLDQAVPEVVREQAQTGIDLVDDGEFGRTSFMTYLNGRLAGYEMRPATKERLDLFLKKQPRTLMPSAAREREQFADFYRVWTPVERSVY